MSASLGSHFECNRGQARTFAIYTLMQYAHWFCWVLIKNLHVSPFLRSFKWHAQRGEPNVL